MRHHTCTGCNRSVPLGHTFIVNGEVLCEPCADEAVTAIQRAKGQLKVERGKDPTICTKCSADFNSLELPTVAGLHLCETCTEQVVNYRYPAWLKVSAAVLFLLLVLSLAYGRPYFAAGRAYYKGMKLLAEGQAQDAAPYFKKALDLHTPSEEVTLNAALAYLKSGQPDEAYEAVKGQSFTDDSLYQTLDSEFKRWERAATLAEEARTLYGKSKYKEAAVGMHNASDTFPEFQPFGIQAAYLDASAAFYARDYSTMADIAESLWEKNQDYSSASTLASAYSSLYAANGDKAMKEKALAIQDKAKSLASSKEEQDDLKEWDRRFEHRLRTRRVLSREQYNSLYNEQSDLGEDRW